MWNQAIFRFAARYEHMTAAASERTIVPDGAHLELPPEVFEVLRQVVLAMSQGLAITVAPQHTASLCGFDEKSAVASADKIRFEATGSAKEPSVDPIACA